MWQAWALTCAACLLLFLILVRFRQRGASASFSLKTMLLVTGLLACGIQLALLGDPWKEVHRFPGHEVNLAISADGKMVAASQGTSIEIRETQTGRSVQTIKMSATEAKAKANARWAFEMGFTPDGKSLMTVGWQTYPCLFDVATGQQIRRWPKHLGLSALAADGSRFLKDSVPTPSIVSRCEVFDVELDQPILTVTSSNRFFRSISPAGSHVLVGKSDTTSPGLPSHAELWNVDEQRLVGTIPLPQVGILFAKFSPDGKVLAVPTSTGLTVWDVAQCRIVSQWAPANFDQIRSLEWSPDGSRLVATYIEMIGPSGPAAAAAALAGASKRNAIEHAYLLDQQCQEIAPVTGTSAAFSPSGDRIATVWGNVNILDGTTGELITWIPGRPREAVFGGPAIYFSPDGDWLFHSGSPTVYHRTRSERWYSVFGLPAFWGVVLFLSALIVDLTDFSLLRPRSE